MSYKFGADEPVREAIERTAREQLDRAISELSERINDDPSSAIHDARKAIKKERSLLRLGRGTMSPAQRRRANRTLRTAGRELSDARDADVIVAAVDDLSETFAGQLPAAHFDAVREHLRARHSAEHPDRVGAALSAHAVQELGAVRVHLDDWQLRRGGWKALEPGLLRSYKRGRRALSRAQRTRTAEDLHALRKRVKDLWYHERLLAPICGGAVHGHAKELDELSDLLGDDHDLAVVRQELMQDAAVAVDVDALINLIDHRRNELQTRALRTAHRIYAEPTRAYRRRMRRSWKAGRALARTPHDERPADLAAATRQPAAG